MDIQAKLNLREYYLLIPKTRPFPDVYQVNSLGFTASTDERCTIHIGKLGPLPSGGGSANNPQFRRASVILNGDLSSAVYIYVSSIIGFVDI